MRRRRSLFVGLVAAQCVNLSVEALLAAGQQPPAGYVKCRFAPHLDDGGELLLCESGVDLKVGGTFGAHPFNESEGFGDGSTSNECASMRA